MGILTSIAEMSGENQILESVGGCLHCAARIVISYSRVSYKFTCIRDLWM